MVFSSIVFLLFFLPVVLALLALLKHRFHNVVLLAVSLLFYIWGEGSYVLLMLWSIAFNYSAGLLVERLKSRLLMGAVVAVNLLPLLYFKYAVFLLGQVAPALGFASAPALLGPIHLPIGISFCTFHGLSYVIDVFRRSAPVQRNPVRMGLYIALFPQLVAGPIIRYNEIADQLAVRQTTLAGFGQGVERFVYGLAKKTMVANPMGAVADAVFALPQQDFATAWVGTLAYTIQIYFDFSAYSDMAIGLGRMLGFGFPENFNYPYIAASIQEFWRRWHLSLSHWFRDYLYLPLGGNRHGALATYRNLLIVFVLCGMWHGANWTFLIWGLWHGAFLVIERLVGDARMQRVWRPLRHAYALLVVMVGWVFFRADDLRAAGGHLAAMAGLHGFGSLRPLGGVLDGLALLALALGLLVVAPVHPWVMARLERLRVVAHDGRLNPWQALVDVGRSYSLVVILCWCVAQLASGTYNPFIYFRF